MMSITELSKLFSESGVPADMYSLDGGLPAESYCINKDAGRWEVYYSEHGRKSGLKRFSSENEACEYLSRIVMAEFTILYKH
jgi:hypothetical protein